MYDKTKVFPIREPEGGGGGSGDVTAAGNNTFTGVNTFENNVNLGKSDSIVTVNGTLQDGNGNEYVTRTDYASSSQAGVVKVGDGLTYGSTGFIYTNRADQNLVKLGANLYRPTVPGNQHQSTFYGLSKAAGANLSGSDAGETAPDGTNPGVYPDTAKTAIREMLGAAGTEDLKDGTLVPKLADNLTPYAEDSGTTQTQPFFLEGTATGNGESRVDAKQVPAYAFLQEKRGNMVCVNQHARGFDRTVSDFTFTIDGDYFIVNGTASKDYVATNYVSCISQMSIPANHTIYAQFNGNNKITLQYIGLNYSGSFYTVSGSVIQTPTYGVSFVSFLITAGTTFNNERFRLPKFVDLTQWFNGNIPAYLLSHPEAFGRYYKGSLAYEPGRLEPATGRYLTSVGRNIWDEEWESGSINSTTGEKEANADVIRSKNYIPISPSTEYYGKIGTGYINACFYDANKNFISSRSFKNTTFISPANAYFMLFRMDVVYGTTYKNDITISLYYSGESGYDQYYPHELLATIDTGTEQLGAFDYKVPSGLITRNTGSYTFTGNESWDWVPDWGAFRCFVITTSKRNTQNAVMVDYTFKSSYGTPSNRTNMSFTLNSNNHIPNTFALINTAYGADDLAAFKTYIAGKTVYFELATPTTEQGTPFQENVPIDDFGQLSWSNTDVPQGNQIFYPVDYKAFEDTLIKHTDGDATSLVRKTDYASSSEAGVAKVSSGYGLQMLADGALSINYAGPFSIKGSLAAYYPITPLYQQQSVFYGLSRAAGVNLASSTEETAPDGTNPGVYPAAAKQAICNLIGAQSAVEVVRLI